MKHTANNSSKANVDAESVNQFNHFAAQWWDKNGAFAALHAINPLRVGWIAERSPLAGRAVLDVGCGGGILCEGLAAHGANVTGADVSARALEAAKLHALESGVAVEYRQIAAEQLVAEIADPQPPSGHDARWDVVCCLELLEHLPRPADTVAACAALVKPGGDVYFSTINRTLKSFLFAIVGAEYVLGLLPRGTHQFDRFIRPGELREWCEAADLRVVDIIGLHYNPFLKNYFLADGAAVNYFMRCVRN